MRQSKLIPRFVREMPSHIDDGILYVSMEYALTMHRCACGCGEEVVTPLSPTDWQLYFDGDAITLKPSIGNWSFPCRAHYFIRGNRIKWSVDMSDYEIEGGRARDRKAKESHYGTVNRLSGGPENLPVSEANDRLGLWQTVKKWFTFTK